MSSQIGGAQTISQVRMNIHNVDYGSFSYDPVYIYIRHTSTEQYLTGDSNHPDPSHSSFTLVYSGKFDFNGAGNYTFNFNVNNFVYNGIDNIEILFENGDQIDNGWEHNEPWFRRTDAAPFGAYTGKVGRGNTLANAISASGSRRHYNLALQFNNTGKNICNFPLPVELASSSLKCDEQKTKIVWQTKSELNNDYFTIEYSEDGKEWRNIKKIKGAGNSTETIDYEVEFENNNAKTVYYRLSQTDFDGTHVKLNTFSSSCTKDVEIMVYPNPAKNLINVMVDGGINQQEIQLVNSVGQIQSVVVQKESTNTGAIDISNLPSGVYYVKYSGGNQNEPAIKRIVKL